MIPSRIATYCQGDFTTIQNYEQAATDNKEVWRVFHRNLITGVGRIPRQTLKALGKYFSASPEELVLLKKADVREIEKQFPMSKFSPHYSNLVFKFWMKLHPNKLFNEITEEEYEVLHRSIQRLRILWNQIKARCHNPNAQDYQHYGARGVRMCREWFGDSDQFVLWSLQNGYKYYPDKVKGDQLSIDRIDPTKNYMPENCRWIPHRENCSRTRPIDWDFVIDRAYQLARMFPKAADVCYGRARINWRKARDIYMGGDTSRLVQFLKDQCYCPMAIWRIRKSLGDVIPQKKSERK